ncbi:hypothetical protein ASG01_09430 [Chryseobacterium sp. Leaf180]|uniref:DUF2251 domain-containing protein n=1 Tax=Chryseobacterium sp. Leaf180 TaxID=1736289 RepID=UPI0006F66E17|nr:DUF2251 domain-containing protein [Chryseobacterium sp. Leaf180]KQR93399.1 hypothetical protein ASG01_09430 [Chryseobacterium sp. Leaf180]
MEKEKYIILDAEDNFYKGEEFFVHSSPKAPITVVFEDTGELGCFYAVNTDLETEIFDEILIYKIQEGQIFSKTTKIQIYWTADYLKSLLYINYICEAVLDFQNNSMYARNPSLDKLLNTADSKLRTLNDQILNSIIQFQ